MSFEAAPLAVPTVTVVVATRNRASLLPRLVAGLEAQEGAPTFEVVVVDDASTDATWEVLTELARSSRVALTALRQPARRGPGPARNRGWRAGSGAIIAFTDDDCVPRPRWLAELTAAIDRADVVQGVTVPAPDQLRNQGAFSRTLEVREATGFFQTCNMAYRRGVLEVAGGFDEAFDHPAGEDTDLALRCLAAGASFAFCEGAEVEHDVRPSTLAAAVRDTWRWQGVVGAVAKHPGLVEAQGSRWFWKPSHPPWLIGALGAVVAIALRGRVGLSVAALSWLPYLHHRVLVEPVHPGRVGRLRYLGHAVLVDGGEVVAMVRGSVRYRRLYL